MGLKAPEDPDGGLKCDQMRQRTSKPLPVAYDSNF